MNTTMAQFLQMQQTAGAPFKFLTANSERFYRLRAQNNRHKQKYDVRISGIVPSCNVVMLCVPTDRQTDPK